MSQTDDLASAVRTASTRPEVAEAVGGLYADLTSRIDARRPLCQASGRCCRFEEFGHRLYVTTLELATFLHHLSPSSPSSFSPVSLPLFQPRGGCPFQLDGLCSVHPIRPFGCRIFFCDETATDWQHQQYEELHTRLKQLHAELAVPYHYVEWRHALATLGLSRP